MLTNDERASAKRVLLSSEKRGVPAKDGGRRGGAQECMLTRPLRRCNRGCAMSRAPGSPEAALQSLGAVLIVKQIACWSRAATGGPHSRKNVDFVFTECVAVGHWGRPVEKMAERLVQIPQLLVNSRQKESSRVVLTVMRIYDIILFNLLHVLMYIEGLARCHALPGRGGAVDPMRRVCAMEAVDQCVDVRVGKICPWILRCAGIRRCAPPRGFTWERSCSAPPPTRRRWSSSGS